jgi:hypothetical protein
LRIEHELASHTEADDERAGGLDEISASGRHAITSLSGSDADAIVFEARLMAD